MESTRLQFRRVYSISVVVVYEIECFTMFNAFEYDVERFRMFNAFNDTECLCNGLECFMLLMI